MSISKDVTVIRIPAPLGTPRKDNSTYDQAAATPEVSTEGLGKTQGTDPR